MYGPMIFFVLKLKVKGYQHFNMTLHILPLESMTVQNSKFYSSMVSDLYELNQRSRKKRLKKEKKSKQIIQKREYRDGVKRKETRLEWMYVCWYGDDL